METICVSPASFPGLCSKGNPGSGAKRRRTGRGQDSPMSKALRKQGARACWKKEHPVIGYQWTTDGFTGYLHDNLLTAGDAE